MLKIKLFSSFLILLILTLTGCNTEGPAVAKIGQNKVTGFDQVVILDKNVSDQSSWLPIMRSSKIEIDHSASSKGINGLLTVATDIRNRTDHTLRLDVRTKFFNQDKILVDESTWNAVVLRPSETHNYQITSIRPNAQFYRVEISEAK